MCKPILQVTYSVEQLVEWLALKLVRFEEEGMGKGSTAFFVLDAVGPVVLQQFDHVRKHGTVFHIDVAQNSEKAFEKIVRELSLRNNDIIGHTTGEGMSYEWVLGAGRK